MSTAAPACLARFFDPEGVLLLGRVEGDALQPVRGDLFAALRPVGEPLPLSEVTLLAPVRPATIVVVHPDGRLSLKPSTAVIGPGVAVRLPEGVRAVEAHPCKAVVIARTLVAGTTGDVSGHLLGETSLCDVVAPDRAALLGGGGYDSFCPLGPWIRCSVGEALLAAVARVAAVLTLYPGDVVAVRSGTPSVVSAGDRVRVDNPGIGILENPVVDGAGDE